MAYIRSTRFLIGVLLPAWLLVALMACRPAPAAAPTFQPTGAPTATAAPPSPMAAAPTTTATAVPPTATATTPATATATAPPPTATPTPVPSATPTASPVAVAPGLTPATADDAANLVWNWTARLANDGHESAVEEPEEYVLFLWPDGAFNVMAECNGGGGTYTLGRDGAFTLVFAPMTRATCGPGSRAREYLAALADGRALARDAGDNLVMTLAGGDALVFAPGDTAEAVAAGLAGVTLRWPGSTDAAGQQVTVDDAMLFALLLRPTGLYTAWADCSISWGVYAYRAGALTLLPGPMVGEPCPVGSQAPAFVEFLSAVRGAAVGDDGAVTMTTADGRRSTFLDLGPVEGPGIHGRTADDYVPERLLNTVWQWTSTTAPAGAKTEGEPSAQYSIALLDDDTYVFVPDCNRGASDFAAGASLLEFNTTALATHPLANCDAGSLSAFFLRDLALVTSFAIVDDALVLAQSGGGMMTFVDGGPFLDAPDARLVGVYWRWVALGQDGQESAPPDTTDFAIVFNDDGTAVPVADCVLGRAGYTTRPDGTLAIMASRRSAAACPTGPLVDTFFGYLNRAGAYAIGDDGALTVELAGGGTMTFAPSP